MLKKMVIIAVLAMCMVSMGGCLILSIDPEHQASHIRSWYQDLKDLDVLTDKYFLNYDANDPFEE